MKITRKSQLVTATLSLLLYWHLLSLPREAVAQAQPAPPSLLTPLDGGSAPYQSVAFSWSPVVGATNGYRIMVAADPTALPTDPSLDSCAGCAVNTTAPLNAHVYTTALDQNAVYYWQVKALAVGGPPSGWSSQSIFTTIGTGGVIQITSPLAHASITDATVTVHGVVENLPP